MPFGNVFNAFETHLQSLQTFDDLPKEEWLKKALNSEQEFAPGPDDDKNELNRKESLQRWYSDQRFVMEKKYLTRDLDVLTNPQKMKEYVENGVQGTLKNYFESHPIKKELKNLK